MAGRRNSYGKRSHSQSDYVDYGRNKRRNTGSDKDSFSIGPDDTVYRYLCDEKKIGSIIGRGSEIVKRLRVDTKSKIRIGETVLTVRNVLSLSTAQVRKQTTLMALKIVFVLPRMHFLKSMKKLLARQLMRILRMHLRLSLGF